MDTRSFSHVDYPVPRDEGHAETVCVATALSA
jgi:hypothetical protein